jgi:hypothetical protein
LTEVNLRAAALAMVFKLVESAQARWQSITGAHLVSLVRAGTRFENGVSQKLLPMGGGPGAGERACDMARTAAVTVPGRRSAAGPSARLPRCHDH